MKYIIIILLMILLVGCTPTIYNSSIAAAELYCKDHNGINRIEMTNIFIFTAYCQDGKHSEIVR
jgi:hypothetical protein